MIDQPLPKPQPIDDTVLAAAGYIRSLLGGVRRADAEAEKKAAKKGATVEVSKGPRKGKLFIANSFPEWQEKILAALKPEFDESTKTFKKDIKQILVDGGLMKEKLAFPFAMETKVCLIA